MSDNPFPGVVGFLTPAMVDFRDGKMLNAFSDPRDIDRVEKGYACGNCCAVFDTFRLDCPICHLPTHVTKGREETPAMWQAHTDERNYGSGKTLTRSPEEFLRDVAADRDIDQVRLSQLKPSKHGRGRPR